MAMVMTISSRKSSPSLLFAKNSAFVNAVTAFSFAWLLLLASSPATVVLSVFAADVHALLEFKKGIKDDPLKKVSSSWNQTSVSTEADLDACPNSFYGVSCDPSSNLVVAIVLDRLNLSGELKFFTLTGLKGLKKLSLSGNNFSGRLVPALGSMTTLEHLDLSGNKFYGPIPERLNDLYGLNHLNLSNNAFRGWYPDGIRNLNQLKILDFHSNQLSGSVKDIFSQLQNVEYVDLSRNFYSGELPSSTDEISSIRNTLQHLNLSYNNLDGGFIPNDTLAMFKNLQVLDLGGNSITGELPSFVSLSNLKSLRLSNNRLSGPIPEELLMSSIPLQELDLSRNGFTGSLSGINSSTLQVVNVSSNALIGSLPSSIGGCVIVDLSGNMISGDISVVSNWGSTLKVLDLSSNMLNGSLPQLASKFQGLVLLRMSNNSLAGNLPDEWNSFSGLSTVDLSANEFFGPVPPSLFSSPNLVTLNLSGNHLSGVIPLTGSHRHELLALASYPPIELLDLSYNNLSGQIPNDLGKIRTMTSLDLSGNGFEGQLPDNLPSSLMSFNVSYNNLSGPIPPNLKRFPSSSFHPGNELLQVPNDGRLPDTGQRGKDHNSKSVRVAIVLASVLAAFLIAFVLLAYYRAQHHAFIGRNKFGDETSGRDVKVGIFNRPAASTLSFSNDHLLTANSRSLSGRSRLASEIIEHVNPVSISSRKSSGSPTVTSPRFGGSEQSVMLDVYSPDRLVGELFFLDSSLSFTAEELSRAPAEVLGRSSHGTLYKATLGNGQTLAVKWLRVGLVKNKKGFAKEVKKIGSLRHPNIVPVRAYYWGPREQERLILADFIHGDNLALHLYESTPSRCPPLSFIQRLRVAVDISRSLKFLHERGIPHGNLKPSNVLLTGPNLSASITDYALHLLMTPTGISEQVLNLGAFGYCAPELVGAPKPTPSFKADVYALGVILMELLTRRSAGDIISGQSGQVDLTDWVRLCDQEGRRMDCVDRDMLNVNGAFSKAMEDMLVISLKCVGGVNERPSIRQVCEELSAIAAA